jgi:hypothetical protein
VERGHWGALTAHLKGQDKEARSTSSLCTDQQADIADKLEEKSMSRRPFFMFTTLLVVLGLLAGCASPAQTPASSGSTDGKLRVIGIYASLIQEPWDGVIHAALTKAQTDGKIEYTYTEDL